MDRRAKIIALNDALRTAFTGGKVRVMPSPYELDARLCGRALCVLAKYNKFEDGSDHDFGSFVFAGYRFEWYIEYNRRGGAGLFPDPADPKQAFRVLTLTVTDDLLVRTDR